MPQVAGIRRFGAAALDLAWVAAGRYDGFWELGLKRWDMAAGLLLVREAGGFVTDPAGQDPRDTGDVIAANPHLHAALSEAVIAGRCTKPFRSSEEDDGFNHCLPWPFPGILTRMRQVCLLLTAAALRSRDPRWRRSPSICTRSTRCQAPSRRAKAPAARRRSHGRPQAAPPPRSRAGMHRGMPSSRAGADAATATARRPTRRQRRSPADRRQRPRCRPPRRPTVALAPVPPPPPAAQPAQPPPPPPISDTATSAATATGAGLRVTFGAGQADLSPASADAIQNIVQTAPPGDGTSFNVVGLCRRHAGRPLHRAASFAVARPRGAQRADGRRRRPRRASMFALSALRAATNRPTAWTSSVMGGNAPAASPASATAPDAGAKSQTAVTRPNDLPDPHGGIPGWRCSPSPPLLSPVLLAAFGNNPLLNSLILLVAADRRRLEPAPGAAAVARGHLAGDLPDRAPAPHVAALAATAGADGQHAGRTRGTEPHRPGALHALRRRRCAACSTASPRGSTKAASCRAT